MYAGDISLIKGQDSNTLELPGEALSEHTFHTIFYGRGRGIHSTQPFSGYYLKDILKAHSSLSRDKIRHNYLIISAADGYRGVFTYSEIFNRNDQSIGSFAGGRI